MRNKSLSSWALIAALVVVAWVIQLAREHWYLFLAGGLIGLCIWLFQKKKHDATFSGTMPAETAPKPGKARQQTPIPNTSPYDRPQAQPVPTIKPAPRTPDSVWVPKGKSVTIGGYQIDGGLLYVGNGLRGWDSYQTEASLIDPSLLVDRQGADYRARLLSYWPSYNSASPEARAAYLKWLAGGRSDPVADIGFVFLYFYGLERRALLDAVGDPAARADLPTIMREAERLLCIYGENGSFRSYGGSLLAYL